MHLVRVGLQRGGYGNPFDVNTSSGAPLADDLKAAIGSALVKRGYTLAATASEADRRLQLVIHEWKTDVMVRMSVPYHMVLNVYDQQGLLATSVAQGEETLGGGVQHQNATNATGTFEVVFSELLRHPEIQAALLSDR